MTEIIDKLKKIRGETWLYGGDPIDIMDRHKINRLFLVFRAVIHLQAKEGCTVHI